MGREENRREQKSREEREEGREGSEGKRRDMGLRITDNG